MFDGRMQPAKRIEQMIAHADNPAPDLQRAIAELQCKLDERTSELDEALAQQVATADVLQVINSSRGDLAPVFDAILENAHNLCGVAYGSLQIYDGERFRAVAVHNLPERFANLLRQGFRGSDHPAGRALLDGDRLAHISDCAEIDYPTMQAAVELAGIRTALFVPLRRDDALLGQIVAARREVRPFTEKEIALLESFAAQAVIAIENARLLGELRQRTDDLSESLQHQTATADVLKVISRSTFDLQTVFETLAESAVRLCSAERGLVFRFDGQLLRFTVGHNVSPEFRDFLQGNPIVPGRNSNAGRAALERRTVHNLDVQNDPEYNYGGSRVDPYRTVLAVPMLKGGELFGVFVIYRHEVRSFTDSQIALMETFADQAVIAIENTRLISETREALDQQTATADVLKVISRSTVDLETVLNTLAETVARLCRADQALVFRRRDDLYHLTASHGLSKEAHEFMLAHPVPRDRGTLSGRVELERRAIHIPDVVQDPDYTYWEGQRTQGQRTMLGVPLLREDSLVGIFSITRTRVDPFTTKEIELATTFADQAVIAIENARLFDELRERQAELRVTFDNMGDGVVMFDAAARLAAWNRNFQEILDLPDDFVAGRPSYAEYFRYLADRGEYSADLEAELSRANEDLRQELRVERTRPDGRVIEVRRNPVPDGGFVLIYADITERKRAEEAIRAARDAAETALRELQTAQDRLVQTQKLASLGQLTAGIAHEIKNPLNFVNNFSILSVELIDELQEALGRVQVDDKTRTETRTEITELADTLRDNLGKIVQHGKRADAIVKNMLLHAREGSGEHRPVDINTLVEESLNLAYHGARAEKQGFNITLVRSFDPAVGQADVFPQDITRVLLNLISNGFDAVAKRNREVDPGDFEPMLAAATRNLGDRVEIKIRDNGTGIRPDVKEKMFNPFFTTKSAGEGTGLGLSISHDIIVKQHAGSIEVDTRPGEFTEIRIILPRVSASPQGQA
jgi:two-component system NtrC family sensor kinase